MLNLPLPYPMTHDFWETTSESTPSNDESGILDILCLAIQELATNKAPIR